MGRTYSSKYNSFVRAFTRSLRCSIGSFTGTTLLTRGPTSLNSHYAIFVRSHIGRTRGRNTSINSVSTKLSVSIVGGTLFGIVGTRSTRSLNRRVIYRNKAFCGRTILHSFRGLDNRGIVEPGVTNLVKTCNTTLVTRRRSGTSSISAVVAARRVTNLAYSGAFRRYNHYRGGYLLAVARFGSNHDFVANGHYRGNLQVGLTPGSRHIGLIGRGCRGLFSCHPLEGGLTAHNAVKVPHILGVCRGCPL